MKIFHPRKCKKEIEVHTQWIEKLGEKYAGREPLEYDAKSYYEVALDYSIAEADKQYIRNEISECDRENIRQN